ncbi:LemA family protein [Thauera aromatica]|uniref:LemA family protein n=1 Tax=Thauera aromatica TaxID=59405 RepID=UPI001FFC6865|nr:LemA family protein [Thauera aromatica]MCK2087462.1 LemA family protein [Thauera aromatica]
MSSWIVIALVVALLAWAVLIYNGLVALRNRVKNAFSQIDVQLQRRYDLIPNLVETAKAYMRHERETLEAVIAARNQARAAAERAEGAPTDAAAMRQLAGAEAALGGMLTRFFALAEAYPELKANQNMMQLQEELASTENRIAFARQAYNDAVTAYNIRREQVPDALIANAVGFAAAEQWVLENADARQALKVDFG